MTFCSMTTSLRIAVSSFSTASNFDLFRPIKMNLEHDFTNWRQYSFPYLVLRPLSYRMTHTQVTGNNDVQCKSSYAIGAACNNGPFAILFHFEWIWKHNHFDHDEKLMSYTKENIKRSQEPNRINDIHLEFLFIESVLVIFINKTDTHRFSLYKYTVL